MSKTPISMAEAYYKILGEKNVATLEKYLHPDVQFKAPLATLKGKEAVLEATKKFADFFKSLTIRTKFGSDDQAMVVYDLECPEPVGSLSSCALLTFQKELITKIELFYDARSFEKR